LQGGMLKIGLWHGARLRNFYLFLKPGVDWWDINPGGSFFFLGFFFVWTI